MVISDATPIQFWLNGELTFNQSNPICGLNDVCFCQPFNCDDTIVIQFTDTTIKDYKLSIVDRNGDELDQVTFSIESISDSLHAYTATINFEGYSPVLCNQMIAFKILYVQSDAPTFDSMMTFDSTLITFDQQ